MNKTIFKSALILIICNLIGKILGAVYRIPLANIIGSEGMGQYQLVFPLFCLVLTISTSGIPGALSKMVAEFNTQNRFKDINKIFKFSNFLVFLISIASSLILVFCARPISKLQGNFGAYFCYYGIAPAILFVGLLSCFRGYFQGNLKMFPTATSSVVEQITKMLFGLYFANRFIKYGTEYAVFGALLGVSISEFVAFVYILICYFIYRKKIKKNSDIKANKLNFLSRQFFNSAVPMTLGGLIMPLSSMIDSLLSVNLLMVSGFSSKIATMMLGMNSGIVDPLLNMPVMIAVSLSTVLLPNLSSMKAKSENEKITNVIEQTFQITFSIAIVCSICFVIFGDQILSFLYGKSFDYFELMLGKKLMVIGSFNIIFVSFVQVSSSILQALGESKYTLKTLFFGCLIKTILSVGLLIVPSINIVGAVISSGICYLFVSILNWKRIRKLVFVSIKESCLFVSIQACFVCLFAYLANISMKLFFNNSISLIVAGGISVLVYFLSYYFLFEDNVELKILDKKIN